MSLLDILKFIGGPGSLGLLLCLSAAGLCVWRVWPERRGFVQAWLTTVALCYLLLALPVTAGTIERLLPPAQSREGAVPQRVDALVVLDGDNPQGRIAQTLTLWHSRRPEKVVVSGGSWMAERLLEAGLPASRVERETVSGTTREQVAWLENAMKRDRSMLVVVVASRLQVPRIRALLQRSSVAPVVVPSPLDREPSRSPVGRFVPSYAALALSREAFYELLALWYYRWRGWIDGTAAVPVGSDARITVTPWWERR